MTGTECGIMAAYDGSPTSRDALCWAAREARARGTTLIVFVSSDLASPGEVALPDLARLARQRGEQTFASGLDYAKSVVGPSRIRAELTGEPPAQALCERSKAAGMVVLGSHGYGGLPGLQLGSVPWQVAMHGHGRIVIVRGKWRSANQSPGPVVAGVDGSPASQDTLAFAFEEAALRGVLLVAVCALADSLGSLGEARRMEEEFSHEVTLLGDKYPDVTVVRQVAAGAPRSALLAAARDAQMIVVGSRGRGGIDGMLLGSVAQALLHHSPCPVAVVRPR